MSQRNIGIMLPGHTSKAMHTDFALPAEYCELEHDCIEYIFGEGQKHIGTYSYNNSAGLTYLWIEFAGWAGLTGTAAGCGIYLAAAAPFTAGLSAILAGGCAICGIITGAIASSAWKAIDTAYDLIARNKSYSVYQNTALFGIVVTGYTVR